MLYFIYYKQFCYSYIILQALLTYILLSGQFCNWVSIFVTEWVIAHLVKLLKHALIYMYVSMYVYCILFKKSGYLLIKPHELGYILHEILLIRYNTM